MPKRWERELQRLGDVPAPLEEIRSRSTHPSPGSEPTNGLPPTRQRVVAGIVALGVAAAGLGFGYAAFRQDGTAADAIRPGSEEGGLIAFTARDPRDLPDEPAEGEVISIGGGRQKPLPPAQIYFVAPDGSGLRQVTDDKTIKGSLAWSPDGSLLAFVTFDPRTHHELLSVTDSEGSDRRQICEGCTGTFWVTAEADPREICIDYCGSTAPAVPSSYRLTWSPDGRWIAAPRSLDGGLALIEVATGEVRTVDGLGAVSGTSWSPDGSSLAVSVDGDDPGVFVVDVGNASATKLFEGDPYTGSPPAWSPDGSTIAFGQAARVNGDLYAELVFIDADDGASRKILGTDELFEVYDLRWSPDGDRLAVLHHPVRPPTAGLLTMAADGSDVQMVALCENGGDNDGLCTSNEGSVQWSADGRRLAFRNYDERSDETTLSVLTLGDGAVPVSGDLVLDCCFSWASAPAPSSGLSPESEPSPPAASSPMPVAEDYEAFVPSTYEESGMIVLPITFPDGSTAEITYPPPLDIAGMGARPYWVGCGHDFGFHYYDPFGSVYQGEPLETFVGSDGSPVALWRGGKGYGGIDFLIFHFGPWTVDLYQYRNGGSQQPGREACAENLRGEVTDDGWLVLDGPPSVALPEDAFGAPSGPEVDFGGLSPRGFIQMWPGPCVNEPYEGTKEVAGVHVDMSREFASWCDAGEMMRIHVYFEPGSDLFTRVFEEVTVRNVTLAD